MKRLGTNDGTMERDFLRSPPCFHDLPLLSRKGFVVSVGSSWAVVWKIFKSQVVECMVNGVACVFSESKMSVKMDELAKKLTCHGRFYLLGY